MKAITEMVGAAFGLALAGALMVMLGAFLIGIGPAGWIILAVLILSR
jgi:hypothetical protein